MRERNSSALKLDCIDGVARTRLESFVERHGARALSGLRTPGLVEYARWFVDRLAGRSDCSRATALKDAFVARLPPTQLGTALRELSQLRGALLDRVGTYLLSASELLAIHQAVDDAMCALVERVVPAAQVKAELLDEILSTSDDIISVMDSDLCFLVEAHEGRRVFGLVPGEALGRGVEALGVPAGVQETFNRAVRSVFETGQRTLGEQDVPTVDGIRRLEYRISPSFGDDGRVQRVIVITRDITPRHTAEKDREMFLAVLGHDLRAPLTAVNMAAQLLRRHAESPARIAELATRIARSEQRMSRLVAQLLEFARAHQGGGLRLSRSRCDLAVLCREVVGEVKLAGLRGRVELYAGEAEGCWDADRIAQVVQNLVWNAIEHSGGHPVRVCLGRRNDRAVLEVHNGGPPIPEELKPVLFEPFRTSRDEGSHNLGLGLYISKVIVDAHGGELHVRSSSEEGTTFRVSLPV
jgi:PAS domain S-box-containing protein